MEKLILLIINEDNKFLLLEEEEFLMKKFSLKFMVVFILVLFTSFIYADGVFSRYYNNKFLFSIDVPITKYEQNTPDDKGAIVNLDFIKNSKFIPMKNFFKGYRGLSGDLLSIESKNKDITISAYGTYFLNSEEVNGLEDIENIKETFKYDNLNYNEFIKKYYNGKSPKNINPLKYDYNKALFIVCPTPSNCPRKVVRSSPIG